MLAYSDNLVELSFVVARRDGGPMGGGLVG